MKLRFLSFVVTGLLFILAPQANAIDSVTVGTIERPPFMMRVDEGSGITGFSIELFNTIAAQLGIDEVKYQEFEVFSDMINATESGSVDLSVANISITAEREKTMDYSQPIYDTGLQILIPAANSKTSLWNLFWESGILYFVGFALLVLLGIAHILWFFELGGENDNKRHDYFRDSYVEGVWDAFWWAFIVMTMGGFENEVPHTKKSRALAMIWIICSLFFISTLTAKITTSLTVAELQSDINSYHDLVGKRVGIPESNSIETFLNGVGVRPITYQTLDELFGDLEQQKLDAVVHDAPILSYFANHDGKGLVHLVGEVFKPDKYAILFPEESPLQESVNQVLAQMYEDGSYKKLKERYFGK